MKTTLLLVACICIVDYSYAQVEASRVNDFIRAKDAASQPQKTLQDVEEYLAFMTDDISDVHVAYGVTREGKNTIRRGLVESTRVKFHSSFQVESMSLGSAVAVVKYTEVSQYVKDDELIDFTGRTILVLEFNAEGLISHMRRYLDRGSVIRSATACNETDAC